MAHALKNTKEPIERAITDVHPRCPHPHPKWVGMPCNTLLIEKATRPWSAICRRCGKKTEK